MNIDDEKSEINDQILLSFGKKIINLFDFPIIVFEKFNTELKYVYNNNIFLTNVKYTSETSFNEMFPEYDIDDILKYSNYIDPIIFIHQNNELNFYFIDQKYVILCILSNTEIDKNKKKYYIKSILNNINNVIRIPLNGIIESIKWLIDSKLTNEQQTHIENVREFSLSFVNVISDLIDFLKIESKTLKLYINPIDIEDVILSSLKIYEPIINKKNIVFHKIIYPNVKKNILGDGPRIQQILINIFDIVLQNTNNGFIKLEVLDYLDGIIIKISNSSNGFTKPQFDDLINFFTNFDYSFTSFENTTRLPIAKYLIEMMNGTIDINSYNNGIYFKITLPLKKSINHHQTMVVFLSNIQERLNTIRILISMNIIPLVISTVNELTEYSDYDVVITNNTNLIDLTNKPIIFIGNIFLKKHNNILKQVKTFNEIEILNILNMFKKY